MNGNNAAGNSDFSRKAMELAQAMEWRTPATHDPGITTTRLLDAEGQPWTPGQRAYDAETGRMAQTGLTQQAETWATPQARDHMPPHSPERIAAMKAEGHGMRNLNDEAATWGTPTCRDHKDGSTSLENVPINGLLGRQVLTFSHPDQATQDGPQSSRERRSLNPRFVEWLMGFPTGWTSLEPAATLSSRWWQLSRGKLWMLCSPRQEPTQGRLL